MHFILTKLLQVNYAGKKYLTKFIGKCYKVFKLGCSHYLMQRVKADLKIDPIIIYVEDRKLCFLPHHISSHLTFDFTFDPSPIGQ